MFINEPFTQFAESELKGEGFRPSGFSLKLIANGKEVALTENQEKKTIEILGQNVEINKVYKSDGKTYVTITSMEDLLLSKIYMRIDGKTVDLKNTIDGQENKNSDGSITHTRTLCCEASGKNLKLEIKGMRYTKSYNKLIDIPIN